MRSRQAGEAGLEDAGGPDEAGRTGVQHDPGTHGLARQRHFDDWGADMPSNQVATRETGMLSRRGPGVAARDQPSVHMGGTHHLAR